MREEVSSKTAEVAKLADVSASSVVENLEGRIREVAAHTDATTTHAVGELQSKMREFVEAHRRDTGYNLSWLEARIDYNRAEARHTVNKTKVAVDKLLAQLMQLAT